MGYVLSTFNAMGETRFVETRLHNFLLTCVYFTSRYCNFARTLSLLRAGFVEPSLTMRKIKPLSER